MATITIKNLERLQKKLDKLSNADMTSVVRKATTFVHAQAKMLAPRDTGDLAGSIHMNTEKDGKTVIGKVYTNTNYAVFNEFGTGQRGASSKVEAPVSLTYRADWAGMSAQPFMYPALKGSKQYIEYIINQGLQDKINSICGGGN